MVSLANQGSEARRARRFSSTSLRTYSAKTILHPPWWERIKIPREALQGENRPSRRTPESRNSLGLEEASLLPIQALETALTYSLQVFQRLLDRNAASRQCLLEMSAEAVQGRISRSNSESNNPSAFFSLFLRFDFRLGSKSFHMVFSAVGRYGARSSSVGLIKAATAPGGGESCQGGPSFVGARSPRPYNPFVGSYLRANGPRSN